MFKGFYYIAPESAKPSVVYQFIKKHPDCYGISVCQTRRDVDTLTRQLKALLPTQGLHDSISWELRLKTREPAQCSLSLGIEGPSKHVSTHL